MIDLLVEYRHWLAGTVMGVGFVGLFIRQEVAHKRRLRGSAAMNRGRKDSPPSRRPNPRRHGLSPMPPNWWTAGGCVAGCWPAIAGRGKAVSAAGGARRLREAQGPSRPKGRPCHVLRKPGLLR